MLFKTLILTLFYFLLSTIAFSQTQSLNLQAGTKECNIRTQKGIECLVKIANRNSKINPDSNEVLLKSLIGFSDENSDDEQLLKLLFVKGLICFSQKRYVQAIKNYKRINEIVDNEKNFQLKQKVYSELGLIYQRLNYPKEANYYYLKSLDIQEKEIQDTNIICKLNILLGHTEIGLHNIEKSLMYYEKSLKFAKKINNNKAIVRAYINLGNSYQRAKEYNKAEEFTQKSLKLSIEHGFETKIPICYLNLAEIYSYSRKDDKAIEYFKKTIASVKTDNLSFILPLCYKNLAIIYTRQKKALLKEEAIRNHYNHINKYDSGLKLAQSLRDLNQILKTDSNYSFVNKYLVRNTELLDSILKSENNNRILMIESLHTLEKEKIIDQQQLANFKLIILLGTLILALFGLIIFVLIKTRRRIVAQSKLIIDQNIDIQAQNEEISSQNEKLFTYKSHLEDLVTKRTEELMGSLEKAEESNRLKSRFLNNMSHEIRTPMNAILGFSQLLEFKENDSNKKYIEIIDKHVNKLLVFLDNIVELSKIQSGTNTLKIKKVSVLQFLKKIDSEIAYIKSNLEKNHIKFELINNQIDYKGYIYTDSTKLFTTIVQILDNAFKFTEQGKVTLTCKLKPTKITFVIEDSGIGIKEVIFPFIFDPFRKIEDGKKVFGGIGIGLALAKSNIELLSGHIEVHSVPNKGSKFTLIIPNKE